MEDLTSKLVKNAVHQKGISSLQIVFYNPIQILYAAEPAFYNRPEKEHTNTVKKFYIYYLTNSWHRILCLFNFLKSHLKFQNASDSTQHTLTRSLLTSFIYIIYVHSSRPHSKYTWLVILHNIDHCLANYYNGAMQKLCFRLT